MAKRYGSALIAAILGVVALVAGLVLKNQADFAHNEVTKQLSAQAITFEPVAKLQDDQKKVACLVANAEKPLTTGVQAQCYADYQIELDIKGIFGKATYATLSAPAREAAYAAASTQAKNPNSPDLPALQAAAAKAEAPASVVFQAETLRGMLLTTYAFDHMGDLGGTTSTILFIAAAVLLLLALGLLAVKLRRGTNSPAVAATS